MMRIITYFTSRFLWALTDSDPYPEFANVLPKKDLNEDEGNNLTDL